jgi:general secretion pathway protein H
MITPFHPAARKPSDAGGFTLIEVMVVVVIIGVISAMLLTSFNLIGNDRNLKEQATRLASLIELTVDEATLQGRDFGLEVMRGGYRFVELDPILGKWNEVIGDDLLRPRTLEENMEFELVIEERNITLEDKAADTGTADDEEEDEEESAFQKRDNRDGLDDYSPHILILSSGDTTPFVLRIVRRTDLAEITLSMLITGELKINAADDENF